MDPAYKILAVEFDETIFRRDLKTWKYEANWEVVQYIRQKAKEGWDIVLITNRFNKWTLNEAIKLCENVDIRFSEINDNPWWVYAIKGQPNKIYWNELIDRWGFHEGKGCEIPEGFDENWGLEDETKNISG